MASASWDNVASLDRSQSQLIVSDIPVLHHAYISVKVGRSVKASWKS